MTLLAARGPRVRKILRIILLIVGVAVVLWLAWTARASVVHLFKTIEPGWSIAAILLGVSLNVLQGFLFSTLLRKHGIPGKRVLHLETYLFSLVGKYLPGGIWAAVSQAAAMNARGSIRAVLLTNLELAGINVMLLAGLGTACIPSLPVMAAAAVLCVTCILLAVALRQQALAKALNLLVQRLPGLRMSASEELGCGPSWGSATASAIFLLSLCAVTSAAVILASGQASMSTVAPMLALLCLGSTAGLIAIPVPAGIGIREASTLALSTIIINSFARGALIAVMLLVRVWQLVVDILSFGLALVIRAVANARRR